MDWIDWQKYLENRGQGAGAIAPEVPMPMESPTPNTPNPAVAPAQVTPSPSIQNLFAKYGIGQTDAPSNLGALLPAMMLMQVGQQLQVPRAQRAAISQNFPATMLGMMRLQQQETPNAKLRRELIKIDAAKKEIPGHWGADIMRNTETGQMEYAQKGKVYDSNWEIASKKVLQDTKYTLNQMAAKALSENDMPTYHRIMEDQRKANTTYQIIDPNTMQPIGVPSGSHPVFPPQRIPPGDKAAANVIVQTGNNEFGMLNKLTGQITPLPKGVKPSNYRPSILDQLNVPNGKEAAVTSSNSPSQSDLSQYQRVLKANAGNPDKIKAIQDKALSVWGYLP
jgi:hypothetical protein